MPREVCTAAPSCSGHIGMACDHPDKPRHGERESSVKSSCNNAEPEAPRILQFHADLLHEKLAAVQHLPRRHRETVEELHYAEKIVAMGGDPEHLPWTGILTPTPPDSPILEAVHASRNRDISRHHVRLKGLVAHIPLSKPRRPTRRRTQGKTPKTAQSRGGVHKRPIRPSKHSMITRSRGKAALRRGQYFV